MDLLNKPSHFFHYVTDAQGRIVLHGLTPEESLEFEVLFYQHDDFRSPEDRQRLDQLCAKHCQPVSDGDREPARLSYFIPRALSGGPRPRPQAAGRLALRRRTF
jgi:hypothetical protein